jgi:hypothetical protein
MINEEEIFSKIHKMPDNLKSEILDYVEFLFNKYNLKQEQKKIIPKFGSAKGKYIMSDDFDEPLEDFKEYMY